MLHEVSLLLVPGRVVGLIGPNGAGKTTLMKRMVDLVPGGGTTTFDGVPYARLTRPTASVAVLLEGGSAHPRRTALNHVSMVAAGAGLTRADARDSLRRVGLTQHFSATPRTFSVGMKRRLALAAALVSSPRTVIMDEPTNGLDVDGVAWFRATVKHLVEDGCSVLLSTHSFADLDQVADQVIVMRAGKVIADVTLAEMQEWAAVREPTVVHTPDAGLLVDALAVNGIQCRLTAPDRVVVDAADPREVGDIAYTASVRLHGLHRPVTTLEKMYDHLIRQHSEQDEAATVDTLAPGLTMFAQRPLTRPTVLK